MRAATNLFAQNNLFQCPADDLECLEMWLGATVCRLENAGARTRAAVPSRHRGTDERVSTGTRTPRTSRRHGRAAAFRA